MEMQGTYPSHPLFLKTLDRLETWDAWRKRWDGTSYVDELSGLLHVAFDVADRDPANRKAFIEFLLEIADGWRDEKVVGAGTCVDYLYRKALAEKAFKTLSEHVFRHRRLGENLEPAWLRGLLIDPLYFNLVWFFDDAGRRAGILTCNLSHDPPKGHYEVWAREFILDLIAKTWDLEDGARGLFWPSEEEQRRMWRQHCADARPLYVRILHGIGRLDLLTRLPIDRAAMVDLRELALQNPYLGANEKYRSIDEALLKGWQAPRVLVQLEAIQRAQRKSR